MLAATSAHGQARCVHVDGRALVPAGVLALAGPRRQPRGASARAGSALMDQAVELFADRVSLSGLASPPDDRGRRLGPGS